LFFTGAFATVIVLALQQKHRAAMVLTWTTFSFLWGCGWLIYFFLDPVKRYATIQFEGFLFAECGQWIGVLLSIIYLGGLRKNNRISTSSIHD
jgi:hypothetical protein